jgi:hypothetical protein
MTSAVFLKLEENMRCIVFIAALSIVALGAIDGRPAQAADDTCQSKAVGKDGKPLAGAALQSFMKKCMKDTCAEKAVGKDGKPLAGAAKTSFMKKCETENS